MRFCGNTAPRTRIHFHRPVFPWGIDITPMLAPGDLYGYDQIGKYTGRGLLIVLTCYATQFRRGEAI